MSLLHRRWDATFSTSVWLLEGPLTDTSRRWTEALVALATLASENSRFSEVSFWAARTLCCRC